MALPPEFFLFFGNRKFNDAKPFDRFVFVRTQETPQGTCLIPLTNPGTYIISGVPQSTVGYYAMHELFSTVVAVAGHQCTRSFRRLRSSVPSQPIVAKSPTGAILPIYEIGKSKEIFGAGLLRQNVTIIPPLAGTLLDASGNPFTLGQPPAQSPTVALSLIPDTINHIQPSPVTKKIKKVKEAPNPKANTKAVGDLSVHVARQLLELAQLKKEQCPITVEDYITGETAVMPCGHLFMQIAIEESFKKEPNKCPACRQYGRPTFV